MTAQNSVVFYVKQEKWLFIVFVSQPYAELLFLCLFCPLLNIENYSLCKKINYLHDLTSVQEGSA